VAKVSPYKIIGADGKEYGPVTIEMLRQWIAEGRANAQSRVRAEGTTDWKSLAEFPEFAAELSAAGTASPTPFAVPSSGPGMGSAVAIDRVNGPAIGLIAVAILGFFGQIAGIIYNVGFAARFASQQQMQLPWASAMTPTISIISALIGIAVSGVILYGALKMRKLENHGMALTSSILAMIPCVSPCCVIGLPIGIWALVVLTKPEVKNAFH
jgi:hypothetical protein